MAWHFAIFEAFCSSLPALGAALTAYYALKLGYYVVYCVKVFIWSTGIDVKKYGDWALVTGSTDGIGKEYAEQLAAKGLNIVLVSRSPKKLRHVSAAIQAAYGVKTKVIIADFSQGIEIYTEIERQTDGLDVGILVNNVGCCNEEAECFHLVPNRQKVYADVINCNAMSVIQMTSLLLPQMLDRRKGVIINVSSLAGFFGAPLINVYGATKSFVSTFSRTLQAEYSSSGIIIQDVAPGFVLTNIPLVKRMSGGLTMPTAKTYVRSALATLGAADSTLGYWPHSLLFTLVSLLPTRLRMKALTHLVCSTREAIRPTERKRD